MSICPWCKAQNPGSQDACLKCGKKASQHPSISGRDMPTLGDFASGDSQPPPALHIELDGAPSHRQGASDMGAAGDGMQSFGDDWDDEPVKGAHLDLADLPGPAPISARLAPSSSTSSTSASSMRAVGAPPSSKRSAVAAPVDALTPPVSSRRGASAEQRLEVDIDRYEILALADYGAEPTSFVQTIPYALRVHRRRRELRRALGGVRAALADAEARRDERMIELGELLRPHVTTNADLRRFAGSLETAEKTRETRSSALADADAAFKDRAGKVDAQIAALEGPLAQAKAEVTARTKAAQDAETLRQKHEARRKRVEIDVRAAQSTLQRADATADEKRRAQATIAAADQEKQVRAAEEKIATTAAQEAEARGAAARRAQEDVEGKLAALRTQRREIERDFSRQAQIRGEGIDAASKEVRAALLEIGRAMANASIDVEGADIRRKSIAESEANVRRLQLELEKHLRALDAANPEAVKRGTIAAIAIVALLVVSFVAWRALRTNPYLDDASHAPAK